MYFCLFAYPLLRTWNVKLYNDTLQHFFFVRGACSFYLLQHSTTIQPNAAKWLMTNVGDLQLGCAKAQIERFSSPFETVLTSPNSLHKVSKTISLVTWCQYAMIFCSVDMISQWSGVKNLKYIYENTRTFFKETAIAFE